jgi:hypothetical protein
VDFAQREGGKEGSVIGGMEFARRGERPGRGLVIFLLERVARPIRGTVAGSRFVFHK